MRKVAGHAGVAENERADELAVRAAVTGEYFASA
jgi:ribonuclease HI